MYVVNHSNINCIIQYPKQVYFLFTIYANTFKWENFCGWYANDYSRENVYGCLLPSRHVLYETYRTTHSIKLHRKIFAIESKISESFPTQKFCLIQYMEVAVICQHVLFVYLLCTFLALPVIFMLCKNIRDQEDPSTKTSNVN